MLVGVPKEIKDNEYRVGLVPSTVRELTTKGHRVLVERNAGIGAGLPDSDYEAAGAELAADADAIEHQNDERSDPEESTERERVECYPDVIREDLAREDRIRIIYIQPPRRVGFGR